MKRFALSAAALGVLFGMVWYPGAKTRNINVYDPDGVRIEINEYGPGSLPKQAVDAWR